MKKLVRFIVSAQQVATGWSLTLSCPSIQAEPLAPARMVRLLSDPDDPARSFPLPPLEEVAAMNPCLPCYRLCADPGELYAVYERLSNRDLLDQDVPAFGGYLFATLLGEPGWKAIQALAGDAAIELALCWPTSDWVLSRLPWELMSDAAQKFLAMYQWPVAITRLVPASAHDAATSTQITLTQPLKALFVIGSAEDDPRIRPGAESLGLLQRLSDRGKNLSLNSHILVRASSQDIEDELASFQPSVVHFICHGSIENQKGSIELLTDDKRGKITLGALELSALLARSSRGTLPIVVLNACYTASVAAPEAGWVGQENVSLAAELVALGVPMVIAMGGEIADHACRMFTWRFYETLLEGGCVINATSEGRWVGITHAGGSTRSIDWACPALFIGDHVSSEIRIEVDDLARKRAAIANYFLNIDNNPPFFCDRLDIVEKDYKRLMKLMPDGIVSVLAIEAQPYTDPEQRDKIMRHGRSRLLYELAARAARDGHIPCLLHFEDPSTNAPKTFPELSIALLHAIYKTWTDHFELAGTPGDALLTLLEETLDLPAPQSVDGDPGDDKARDAYRARVKKVKDKLRKQVDLPAIELDSDQVKIRAQQDLSMLAQKVRQQFADAPYAVPLLLIDDVHCFDAAAGELLTLLGRYGLGKSEMTIPVVFSFLSAQRDKSEFNGAMRMMSDFLSTNKQFITHVVLKPFASGENSGEIVPYLPYQQYLLHYSPPLVWGRMLPRVEREQFKREIFQEFHTMIKGMPSRLTLKDVNYDVAAFIKGVRVTRVLEEANNEAILKEGYRKLGKNGA